MCSRTLVRTTSDPSQLIPVLKPFGTRCQTMIESRASCLSAIPKPPLYSYPGVLGKGKVNLSIYGSGVSLSHTKRFEVVLQKSAPPQIRRRILYYC